MKQLSRLTLVAVVGLHLACSLGEAQVSVVGSLHRTAVLQPGETGTGRVVVRNNSTTRACAVHVYQTDHMTTADGRTEYGKPGLLPRSNASWITFAPHQFTLEPGGTVEVEYEVHVPRHVDLPGTYWSMLMIEPQADLVATPAKPGEVAVRTILRYGVHISTQVGDTGKFDMTFADKQVVKDEQGVFLQLDLANTGERLLTPQVWADVYDMQGVKVAHLQSRQAWICPGCSTRVRLDLISLGRGQYNVLVVADNGDEHVFGTRFRLDAR